jgi:hypothetical protein
VISLSESVVRLAKGRRTPVICVWYCSCGREIAVILDEVQRTWDARRVESRFIAAASAVVYRCALETDCLDAARTEFARFSVPGNARIACNVLVVPENGGTRVTYEARTPATDAASPRGFLRYWRFVPPLAGAVMRAALSGEAHA